MKNKPTPIHLIRALIVIKRDRARKASRTGINLLMRSVGLVALIAFLAVIITTGMAVGIAAAAYTTITANLATPEDVAAVQDDTFETTKIYAWGPDTDGDGKRDPVLIYEVIDPNAGDRNWVTFAAMPDHVVCGTIAAEDKTFWTNPGFNTRGTIRAFVGNILGDDIQGGSSITQQVVKNSVIPIEERFEKSYARKIKEILISLELTRLYEKEEILEWYINTNFYGNLAYGIGAAARVYFDKTVEELTISEAATLIAIPQYPRMNPFDTPETALERKNIILNRMLEEGCITTAEAQAAEAELWQLAVSNQRFDILAPHFSMYVRHELEERYGAEVVAGGGLSVYTTLDLALNAQAECTIQTYLRILNGADPAVVIPEMAAQGCAAAQYLPDVPARRSGEEFNVKNSAVMVIRPNTGEILAMIGSADYWNEEIDGKFNVAVDGLRQPGSSFKPFTYATFLAQGYPGHNPAYMFLDARQAFDQGSGMAPYVPENYTRRYYGPVSLRSALARSLNIPAVEAMSIAGIDEVLRTAHRMGITTLDKGLQHYGLSLTLGGGEVKLIDMVYAFSVFANNGTMYGTPVPEDEARPGFRELNPVAILRVEDRDGNILYQYNQPETRQVLEERVAYLITHIISDRYARIPADYGVCTTSGLLSNGNCPIKYELMIPGTEPTEEDKIHQVYLINRDTNKLATIFTPPELVEHKVYKILPPEAEDWINSLPEDRRAEFVPPSEYDDIGPNRANAEVAITSPVPYAYVGGVVPIMGNARGGDFAMFRLLFGQGLNPTEWMQIGPDHGNQVENNLLENFDTTGLQNVPYTLQIQVIGHDQQVRQATVQVTVDNEPPKADLTYPPADSEYEYGFAEWVNVNAEVHDNYAIERVEFYYNNQAEPFKVRNIAPFNVNWTPGGPGQYQFHVVVYDAAGNETKTAPVTIYVIAREEPQD